MECKGTREEWVNFIGKFAICKEDKAAILREVDLHGWITKPEWEQAYDDYKNTNDPFSKGRYAIDAVDLMAARIRELEGKEG